ncbi:MAG: 3-hydroxyacyl-CoA dehydrogenase, partial [Acetobacteraceae bacterium]|nr:3-hydroxyacyl-CoA dehydrogenase [Acetobacteraceae bacterium]
LVGPLLFLLLSVGPGGFGALFGKPLWRATEAVWQDLGNASVDNALAKRVAEGIKEELAPHDEAEVLSKRDEVLLALLNLKAKAKVLP